MAKMFALITFLIATFNCCNYTRLDSLERKIVINKISKGGILELYKIHEQYINNKSCNGNIHYASVYLCTNLQSNDSVLIISPCSQSRFQKDTTASLFVDQIIIGDTLTISIPKKYEKFLNQERTVGFGILGIPKD
jgi:hypothetical protein